MILLIGPDGWVFRIKRLLEDRTTHSRGRVVTSRDIYHGALRGAKEHVEVIQCTEGWEPSHMDWDAMEVAEIINSSLDTGTKGR